MRPTLYGYTIRYYESKIEIVNRQDRSVRTFMTTVTNRRVIDQTDTGKILFYYGQILDIRSIRKLGARLKQQRGKKMDIVKKSQSLPLGINGGQVCHVQRLTSQ